MPADATTTSVRAAVSHRRFWAPTRVRTGRGTRLPAGLLGMLALVVAVETRVAAGWERVTDPVAFSWRWSAEAAGSLAPGRRVLCVGDSLTKHGLVPGVIEAESGLSAVNLASAAGPAPWTYFVLRRAYDAGARPDAVVINFKPSVLAGGPKYQARDWPEVLDARETVELLRAAGGGSFAASLIVGKLLPSVRARHDLRDNIARALRGEPSRLGLLNAICRRNWSRHDGANLAMIRPGYDGSVSAEQHAALLSDRFYVHKVNAVFARRAIGLATARGAKVFLVIPPMVPEVTERRARSGSESGFTEFVAGLRREFPDLSVVDARGSRYPAGAFVDATHLNRRGSVALSVETARVLRVALDTPGGASEWHHLPTYRERPDPVPLEDAEQSRIALGLVWPS